MKKFWILIGCGVWLAGCASAPKMSTTAVSEKEASAWLNQYCSKLTTAKFSELTGDLVLRSDTKEFKGQYPASLRFSSASDFSFEVTHILGGTLARLEGHQDHLDLFTPSKPQYNRKGIQTYMGLPVPILMQLLHGDLPCPEVSARKMRVKGAQITLEGNVWSWVYDRSAEEHEPLQVTLISAPVLTNNVANSGQKAPVQIRMKIVSWDHEAGFAKRVEVTSPEGSLKWTWRNRDQK